MANEAVFEDDPETIAMQAASAKKYEEDNKPHVNTVVNAFKNPSPENNIAASEALKKMIGTDEPQWGNVIQSVLNLNLRDLGISLNGGANVPSQAYDQNGKLWYKVFNERKTKQNPYGELRFYLDPETGKKYTQGELEKNGFGPVLSQQEIPIAQQNWYKAKGITSADAAKAQIGDWNKKQTIAAAAASNGSLIQSLSEQLDPLYNDPKLLKMSVNPAVRELIAGINDIRTGNKQNIQKAAEAAIKFIESNKTSKDVQDAKKQGGGFSFGLNYAEGKNLTDSEGKIISKEDIRNMMNRALAESSTEAQVNSRQKNLLERAQLLAANGQLENIDLMQRVIDLEAQKARAINNIEQAGGIGIAQPTLVHEVGDSWTLAGTKNKMSRHYGEMSNLYSTAVNEWRKNNPGKTPAIGDIEALINSQIGDRRENLRQSMLDYVKSVEPIQKEISAQPVPTGFLPQPQAAKAEIPAPDVSMPKIPASAPPPAAKPAVAPAGSKPPKKSLNQIREELRGK